MEIESITPQSLLEKLNELCAYLIDKQDYSGSSIAEKFRKELEIHFELKRVQEI